MKRLSTLLILIVCSLAMSAQTDRQLIRQGNKDFRQQNVDKAEVAYRKAVDRNSVNSQAAYNLGCALMMQGKAAEAVKKFEEAANLETNKVRKAASYYNIGVICHSQKLYKDAIESYKESLRNNPKNDQCRYNLELAKHGKGPDPDPDSGGQDSDDKDENGSDKSQDSGDNKTPDDNKEKKEQMSKENAEQLLQAAMQEEKQTQQKMKKQQVQSQKRRLKNNW